MESKYQAVDLHEAQAGSVPAPDPSLQSATSAAQLAWQRVNTFQLNGVKVETPFAHMNVTRLKWYFIGSFIIWSLIFYGGYKVWTTTMRPFLWGPHMDTPLLDINPDLLDNHRTVNDSSADVKHGEGFKAVVRRPVRKKPEVGILDRLLSRKSA